MFENERSSRWHAWTLVIDNYQTIPYTRHHQMSDPSPTQLSSQAIHSALAANWEEALRLNQQILATDPKNVDALNRLARAHFELGDLKSSKKYYEAALSEDPYNQIAAKFLKRIEVSAKKGGSTTPRQRGQNLISTDSFIEEPGKTKLVTLIKVAEPQRLSQLSPGESVQLVAKNRGVVITGQDDKYLGIMPDDIGHRLLRLIKGGNKYQACIKTVKTNGLSVLIREIHRAPRFKNQPSFLDNLLLSNLSYSSDHIILQDESDQDPSEDEEIAVN